MNEGRGFDMNCNVNKERDLTIDIVKAIGIFCMVAGHSAWPFTHFVYLFHMALFFIASGYCYKEDYSYDKIGVRRFIKRKIITLWFPYVLWTTIYSVLHNFFIHINIYTDNPLLLEYVRGKYTKITMPWTIWDVAKNILKAMLLHGGTQLGGAFWFLATLMEVSICYCVIDFLLRNIFKNDYKKTFAFQWIISIMFLVIGYISYKIKYTCAGLDKMFSYYILFHGGFTMKNLTKYRKELSYTTHIVILIMNFVVLLFCNKIGTIELGGNSYMNPVYFLIVSFCGWQFVYEIAFMMEKNNYSKKLLACIGQNTLPVVILHFLCFKLVNYIGVLFNHQPLFLIAAFPILYKGGVWWIAYTLVGLIIPICLNLLYKKIKTIIFSLR